MDLFINRILGMDIATRRRSIEAFVLYIFMIFATFNLPVPGEQWQEFIVKLLGILLEGFVLFYEEHYKNNDHTEVAAEYTGEMRQKKNELRADYVGERFYTEEINGVDPDDEADELVEENVPIEDDIEFEEGAEENE